MTAFFQVLELVHEHTKEIVFRAVIQKFLYWSWIPDSRTKQRTALKWCSWGAACKFRNTWISNVESLAKLDSDYVNECFNDILLVYGLISAYMQPNGILEVQLIHRLKYLWVYATNKYLNVHLCNFIIRLIKPAYKVWGAHSCFHW